MPASEFYNRLYNQRKSRKRTGDMGELAEAGVVAFSDDGSTIADSHHETGSNTA